MMKKAIILVTWLFLLSAWGCVREQNYDCPQKTQENTTVLFSLEDGSKNQILLSTLDHISLFLYGPNGKQMLRRNISKGELNLFSGVRLTLDPGTYTIVAWANHTNTYTRFLTNDDRPYLEQANNYLLTAITANGKVVNGDPLYFAPKTKGVPLTVTVPTTGSVEVTAPFRNAHIKLEVTVEGYQNAPAPATDPLTIELTNITSRYSFGLGPHGDRVSYVGSAPLLDAQNKIFRRLFNVPLFDKNTPTYIHVTNSAGQLIDAPVSLKDLLDDKVNLEEILYLPIRIIFTEENGQLKVAVVVDLPEWKEGQVKPNI